MSIRFFFTYIYMQLWTNSHFPKAKKKTLKDFKNVNHIIEKDGNFKTQM